MGLQGDERAVSSVVAAVLLFGFLVIGLSLHQGFVVPSQNEEVEFSHNQEVRTDMLEARNAVLRTKSTGEDGFVAVDLGTTYPPRIVAINPPPASGTLRTTEARPVAVHNRTGTDVTDDACPGDAETRFLEYSPSYSEYGNAPTTVYENSVVYDRFDSGNVTASTQTLVRNDTVSLVPLRNEFFESGSRTVAFEPRAGQLTSTTVTDPTVTVPTRLGESDWERLLDGHVDPPNVAIDASGDQRNLTLDLDGEYTVECGPVGVSGAPPSGGRDADGVGEINPVGPNDVELRAAVLGSNSQDPSVLIDLNNTANRSTEIQRARISFLFDEQTTGGGPPTEATVRNATTGVDSATLVIQGEPKVLSPRISLVGNRTTTTVEVEFDETVTDSDFFVVQLTFANGQTGTYFVAPESP